MKTLINFISKNFLLYLLFVFVVAKAFITYAVSEYQNDMAVKYATGANDQLASVAVTPISEQSLLNSLDFAKLAVEK